MKVWVCFLVGLVIGVGVSVAAAEHYPRPWENASWVEENGHMYDFAGVSFFDTRGASLDDEHELIVEGLLNESIPDFQDSLEEMELEALSLETIRRGEKDKNLGQALYHFGLAGEIDWSDEAALVIGGWDACADIGSDIGGTVGTAAGAGVGAAAGAGVGAAASAGTGTAVGTGVGAVVGTGVGFVVGETLGGLLIGGVCAGAGASAGLVSQQLDAWNYPENWKNCANYALYSLESKGRRVNNLVELFEAKEELMRSGGVCDSDYAGPGLEYCGVPLPDVDCNHSGLWDSVPGFSWYYNCTQEHWETIDSLEMIVDGIALSYNETIEQCGETKGLVASRKEEADLVMSGLAAERLEVITLGGGGENGALSVQEAYAGLRQTKNAGDEMGSAALEASEEEEGWLKTCIVGGGNAIANYDLIIGSPILNDAEKAVDSLGEDAESALAEAERLKEALGGSGLSLLVDAQEACSSGENAFLSLGERFEEYAACATYAKMAVEAVESGEDEEEVVDAYLDSEVAWLDGFLKRAEKDGIDTRDERAQYLLLKNERLSNYRTTIDNIEKLVLDRAQQKYGHLPEKRKELKSIITAGGSSFRFLESWFESEECYDGWELDYLCALGNLREIAESYHSIEGALEDEKDALVKNSLVLEERHSWGVPVLDGASDLYLYVDVTNPTKFSGEDIMLKVSTDFDFRKIDLVSGSGRVRMVTPKSSYIEIYLTGLNASETLHLVFKKEEVLCRTKEQGEAAYGDSVGGAMVTQTIKIECGYSVGGLVVDSPPGTSSLLIDGIETQIDGGAIKKELAKGSHTLVIESYDPDAYSVERQVSFVSTMGQETKIELFFAFLPNKDLDYIAYSSVEEGKDLSKLDVFGYTGEKLSDKKVLGESTVFFKVYGLVEGKETKVRVTYQISDLEEYVVGVVAAYSAMNLTSGEAGVLNEAKNYLAGGEVEEAYETLEGLRSMVETRERAHASLLLKHEKLKEVVVEKIALLESALEVAGELGLENPFVSEIRSRLEELKGLVGMEVEEDALRSPLESIDMGWEKKELTKLSNALLASEKEIKEGWAELEADDVGLEAAVREIEELNSKFSGSLDFEDAMHAFHALLFGEIALENAQEMQLQEEEEGRALLESKVQEAYDLWEEYNKEYEEADETHLEGRFPLKPLEVTRELKKMGGRSDYSEATMEVEAFIKKMGETLALLKEEEKLLEENVISIYSEVNEDMGEIDSEFVNAAIQNAKMFAGKGEYVQAIKSLEDGLRRMQTFEKKEDGIIILAITGLLVLGIVALYLLKDHLPKDLLPRAQKNEHPYRKLRREV